jgi:hypothetical protein
MRVLRLTQRFTPYRYILALQLAGRHKRFLMAHEEVWEQIAVVAKKVVLAAAAVLVPLAVGAIMAVWLVVMLRLRRAAAEVLHTG